MVRNHMGPTIMVVTMPQASYKVDVLQRLACTSLLSTNSIFKQVANEVTYYSTYIKLIARYFLMTFDIGPVHRSTEERGS